MSNLTINIALATVKRYQDSTPEQDLAFAQALAFLQTTDPKTYSVRGLVTIGADLGRPVGRNRIALLIRAVKAAPEDVTAADFRTIVKDLTDANRGSKVKEETAPVTGEDTADETGTVPQGDSRETVTVAAMPVTDAIRLLWELIEHHGEDTLFAAALATANDYVNTEVKIATPVAA